MSAPAEHDSPPPVSGGRVRRRRWWWIPILGIGAAAAVLVGSVALSVIPSLGSVRHLREGRAALTRAEDALRAADTSAALRSFEQARASFGTAIHDAGSPLIALPASLPFLGRTYDGLRTLADVGEQVASTGAAVARSVSSLPGGASALAPAHGRLPLDLYARLAPVIGRAATTLGASEQRVETIATSMVPSQIVQARRSAERRLADAVPTVRSAEQLLRWLPAFGGGAGPRSYFVAVQNPAELRGTGGLIGMYSILTLDGGRIHLEPFRDVPHLGPLSPSVAAWPSPATEDAFGSFDAATVLHNTNVPPDVPTASELLLDLWRRTQHARLDGVLWVDTQAIKDFLRPLGRVHVPGIDPTLKPSNVVTFMTSSAYDLYPNRDVRKALLSAAGTTIFDAFFRDAHGEPALQAIADAAGQGLLRAYATDPQVEEAFRVAGISGTVTSTGGPMFGAFVNNIGGNKLDYYLHVDLGYDLRLSASGSGRAEATVTLRNDAPQNPPPGEVFGPYRGAELQGMHLVAGETYLQVFFYCGEGCSLVSGTVDGDPLPLHQYELNGLQMYSTSLRVLPQASRTVQLTLDVAGGWDERTAGDQASLRILTQPMLNPVAATIRMQPPAGRSIAWTDPGSTPDAGGAAWKAEPGPSSDYRIGF